MADEFTSFDRLAELTHGQLYGFSTPAEIDELDRMLNASDESLQQYIDLVADAIVMRRWASGSASEQEGVVATTPTRGSESALIYPAWWRRPSVQVAALAALIALAVSAWFLMSFESQPAASDSVATTATALSPVGILADVSGDAVFAETSNPTTPGSELPPGPIHLIAGKAQLMFKSTAVVDLAGPCEFEMTGFNRGRLSAGSLGAYVPQGARGFTLDLPQGVRIVDLGTQFQVMTGLEGPNTVVQVLQGRVELKTPQVAAQIITPGDIWRVLKDGSVEKVDASVIVTAQGRATPFDSRLPGTGMNWGQFDATLKMAGDGLQLRSTLSDLRGAQNLDDAQFIGINLRELGDVTGGADVTIEAVFDRLPTVTRNFDSYGIFVGTSADAALRAGVLHWDERHAYSVTTLKGGDIDLKKKPDDEIKLNERGELVVRLRRVGGTWSAMVGDADMGSRGPGINMPTDAAPVVAGVFVNHTDPASGLTVRLKHFTARVGDREKIWSASIHTSIEGQ